MVAMNPKGGATLCLTVLAITTLGAESRGKIDKSFNWLKGTEWHWNDWNNVIFEESGKFTAPAPECTGENKGECYWEANYDKRFERDIITVHWGSAGEHYVIVKTKMKELYGQRHDGEEIKATFKRKRTAGSKGPVETVVGAVVRAVGGDQSAVGSKIAETYNEFAPLIDYEPMEVYALSVEAATEALDWYKGLLNSANSKDMKALYKQKSKEMNALHKKVINKKKNTGYVFTAFVVMLLIATEVSLVVSTFVLAKVPKLLDGESSGTALLGGGSILMAGMLGRVVTGI